ncbi:MAG: hypothetical protein RLY69_1152, partial [Verrucomicrobiota bacterium]
MRSICLLIGFMFALVFPSALMAAGKADNKASLSFHIETDSNDNPKMI